MTFWRSSLDLPETRTASPWICDLTLGNSSRMSLLIFLASSSLKPASQADDLADLVAAGRLDLAPVEDLEAEAAPDGLGLEEVLDRRGPALVVGQEGDLLLAQLELGGHALEVVARADLPAHLVQGVDQLLVVEIADHVE